MGLFGIPTQTILQTKKTQNSQNSDQKKKNKQTNKQTHKTNYCNYFIAIAQSLKNEPEKQHIKQSITTISL